jgi:hypothetical protein
VGDNAINALESKNRPFRQGDWESVAQVRGCFFKYRWKIKKYCSSNANLRHRRRFLKSEKMRIFRYSWHQ